MGIFDLFKKKPQPEVACTRTSKLFIFKAEEALKEKYDIDRLIASYEQAIIDNGHLDFEDGCNGISIEIDGAENTTPDMIKEVLSLIPQFDSTVLLFCSDAYKQGTFAIENYVVELAWIEIDMGQGSLVMGYHGIHVNIEARAIFVKVGTQWQKDDIYYQ